ncbi:Pyocin activator protein PrtN [Bradyrhizobium sp. UNPF46]|uniref:pyocin activator PrtN family protein n=1 Tax=Bradyrhizobium sp. UNPF46 TaxID=1141168 RepID=UPI00114F741B|nr:pyocin activator PrtN family protein [Bradyrhizobium sp. UNPF46]TQF35304.1 Pyocin activator protein PrtN [Bradyrhizobium sp. UNPF46]
MSKADTRSPTLNTAFLLMAQYGGKAIIPVEELCRDYFSHLDPAKFIRKVGAGEIMIPLVRMEASQKCAKGVHLQDLADYLDARRAAALKECRQLAS